MRAFLSRLIARVTGGPRDDFSWMFPPKTLVDPAPWDRFWHDHLTHGMAGILDMWCDDGPIIDAMRANGLKTVLCVGNGISQEPRALAWAGFEVTALDLSPFASQIAERAEPTENHLASIVGGRSAGSNGYVTFVVGDLCDPACCPGPYDVVIERRTLQLYPEEQRPAALNAVADRLASPGIFFSQAHNGAWRPPQPRNHIHEPWFVQRGWERWQGDGTLKGRVAWLFLSTG